MSTVWSEGFFSTLVPKPKMTVSEWADENRYVATGPEKGRWRTARTPYLREIMDAASSHDVERIVMMCSSQIGKTELILNVVGYYMAQEPCETGLVFPIDSVARRVAVRRVNPMIEQTEVLRDKVTEIDPMQAIQKKGHRKRRSQSTETQLMKVFPGGSLTIATAASSSSLAEQTWRVALADEIDRGFENDEGDARDQFESRTKTFGKRRKIIYTSTPTTVDGSKIYEEYLKGDQRKYNIPCPSCGVYNEWTLSQVEWEKNPDGSIDESTIQHKCPDCDHVLRGAGPPREDVLATGEWIPTAPENTAYARSYHIWEMYSPWVALSDIVRKYVQAKRSKDPLQLMGYQNLTEGLPWKEKRVDDDLPEILYKRREHYNAEVPYGVGLLTCGVDVQKKHLVAEVVGWGIGKESFGIEYRVFPGDPTLGKVWADLEEFLLRKRMHESGAEITIHSTMVDSGYATDDVYEFTTRMQYAGVFASKGSSTGSRPFFSPKPSYPNGYTPLYLLGVNQGKLRILEWAKLRTPGPGYSHFPRDPRRGYDHGYFKGLISETYTEELKGGKMKRAWHQHRVRNEPLDVRNYAMAALENLIHAGYDLEAWANYYDSGAPVENVAEDQSTHGKQLSKGLQL